MSIQKALGERGNARGCWQEWNPLEQGQPLSGGLGIATSYLVSDEL